MLISGDSQKTANYIPNFWFGSDVESGMPTANVFLDNALNAKEKFFVSYIQHSNNIELVEMLLNGNTYNKEQLANLFQCEIVSEVEN